MEVRSLPTIVSGQLLLSGSGIDDESAARLLDVTGRAAMALKPGTNDISAVRSGVYFVVKPGVRRPRKVIVTR